MKTEAEFKRWVVNEFKVKGYARRIEDSFSVGFPDLVLQIPGDYPVFFVEAKMFDGNVFGPSPRQYVELQRLAISKHSHPMLLGWHRPSDWVYFHPHCEQVDIRNARVWRAMRGTGHLFDQLKEYYDNVRQS